MKFIFSFLVTMTAYSVSVFAANTNYTTSVVQSKYAVNATTYARTASAGAFSAADRTVKIGLARSLVGRIIYVDQSYTGSTQNGGSTTPYKTIGAAVLSLNTLASTILISEGTYREFVILKGKTPASLLIQAKQGHTVFIKGSDIVNAGWVSNGGGLFSLTYNGPRAQMAFFNRQMLQEVNGVVNDPAAVWWGRMSIGADLTKLPPSSYWHDLTNHKIWVRTPGGLSPNGQLMELAVREGWVTSENMPYLTIRDINFEHSNTYTFWGHGHGALQLYNNSNATMDNISAAFADGNCIGMGPTTEKNIKLINSNISYCGQTGVSGNGDTILLQNNKIKGNNTRGFSDLWHAGGIKFVNGYINSTVDNNEISYNYGPGFWCDYCKVGPTTVTNNLFIHNEQEGIHLEVSTRLNINGNYFFGNKIAAYVRESSYVTVQNNMMMMSRGYSTDVFDGPRAVNVPGGCTCFNNLSGNKMVAGLYRLQKPANNTSNSNFFVSPNTYIGDGSKTLPAFISATGDDKLSLAYINKNPTSYTVDGATMLVRANSKIFTSKAQMDQFYSQMAH